MNKSNQTAETQSNPQPGSWYIHPGSPSCVRENDGTIVADHCTPQHARLIAAAPDLLAALQGLVSEIHLSKLSVRKDFSLMVHHAEAVRAIAKARGENSPSENLRSSVPSVANQCPIAALERLLRAPDLNLDELEPETIAAIEHAGKIIAKAKGENPCASASIRG